MTNNKNNSIINVTVNGLKATQCVENVKSRLETVEKSVFNIALISCYACGTTIPQYVDNKGETHASATCENHFKQVDFIKKVGRSESTLSRWISAMDLIIENGYFNDFALGIFPFSYDKIHIIFKEENKEVFKGEKLSDLMALSVNALKIMVSDYNKKDNEEEEENVVNNDDISNDNNITSNDEEENISDNEENISDTSDDEEAIIINVTIDDKIYTVDKTSLLQWLEANAIVK